MTVKPAPSFTHWDTEEAVVRFWWSSAVLRVSTYYSSGDFSRGQQGHFPIHPGGGLLLDSITEHGSDMRFVKGSQPG